jgi:2-polyprenyl-3-methyl-5-hydroxy-6-metoxy-1,4-benzoquinol methylase
MACYLCGSDRFKFRDGEVRDKKELKILECLDCSLVYLSDFSHLKDGFYEESNMHSDFDLKRWINETDADDKRRYNFTKNLITNRDVLDFGSGNGGYLKYAKTRAKSVSAIELEKAIEPHYKEQNIKLYSSVDAVDKGFDHITMFHVLEHLNEPKEMLVKLADKLRDGGKIIVEVPNSEDALLTLYESEPFSKFTYWSCHLFLFNARTLQDLVHQSGLKVEFIKHIQRYPLSNHLYWLSKNRAGGHQQWGSFLDSDALSVAYEESLASMGKTDTLIAQISKV